MEFQAFTEIVAACTGYRFFYNFVNQPLTTKMNHDGHNERYNDQAEIFSDLEFQAFTEIVAACTGYRFFYNFVNQPLTTKMNHDGHNERYNDQAEIFSRPVKAGKRTYFFDVKAT